MCTDAIACISTMIQAILRGAGSLDTVIYIVHTDVI